METLTATPVEIPASVDDDDNGLRDQVLATAIKVEILTMALAALVDKVENVENVENDVDDAWLDTSYNDFDDEPEPEYRSENRGGC